MNIDRAHGRLPRLRRHDGSSWTMQARDNNRKKSFKRKMLRDARVKLIVPRNKNAGWSGCGNRKRAYKRGPCGRYGTSSAVMAGGRTDCPPEDLYRFVETRSALGGKRDYTKGKSIVFEGRSLEYDPQVPLFRGNAALSLMTKNRFRILGILRIFQSGLHGDFRKIAPRTVGTWILFILDTAMPKRSTDQN